MISWHHPLQVASYTNFFADALVAEAKLDKRIIGIHAAMGGGTGMNRFEQHFPERTFDVGIAEQVCCLEGASEKAPRREGGEDFVEVYMGVWGGPGGGVLWKCHQMEGAQFVWLLGGWLTFWGFHFRCTCCEN